MAVLLRASRARRSLRAARTYTPVLPWPPLSGWGPHWLRHLLALVDGLLAVADGLDFICSGAWLLPYADELVASAKANAPATSSSSG